MMMKGLMKIQIILVFVLLAFCLFGCSKQSEESSESVTQKDAGTDSYMTVTVNADFQFYEENYPGHWACFYHPEFYTDKDCNSELMDISMDSIDSTIKYKIQAHEGLSEVFIVLPVIRIVEDIKPVAVKINEASDTEFNGFSIAGIGIPQLVEWKSTDTIFEIVVAIQSESDCFPAHLRIICAEKQYIGTMVFEQDERGMHVQYRFPISLKVEESATVMKNGQLWFDGLYHYIAAENIRFSGPENVELEIINK